MDDKRRQIHRSNEAVLNFEKTEMTNQGSLPPQWGLSLFLLCIACLLEGFTYSHIASFFNQYSVDVKELSLSQYGIIMSSYCVVVLIVTPLAARLLHTRRFTDRTILCSGLLLDAVFTLGMAWADKLPPGPAFFFGCLIFRIVQAAGRSVAVLMIYVIACAEMPSLSHVVIPLLETIYGLSVVIGPAISGVLYSEENFASPFLVIGGTLLTFSVITILKLPKPSESVSAQAEGKGENEKSCPSHLSILNKATLLNVVVVAHVFILISSNESTLALHINDAFGWGPSQGGLIFLFSGVSYAASSLAGGYVMKHVSDSRLIVVTAMAVCSVALILQGPLVPMKNSVVVFSLAQTLLGLGSGPLFVCSYLHSVRCAGGDSGSKDLHAALMTLFNPAASVGCTIGPFIGGVVGDHFSYVHIVALNAIQNGLVLFVLCVSVIIWRAPYPEEKCLDIEKATENHEHKIVM